VTNLLLVFDQSYVRIEKELDTLLADAIANLTKLHNKAKR